MNKFVKREATVSHQEMLKEYYARYLIDIRGLKQSSVKHYFDALNNISRRLKAQNLIKESIYEVVDYEQIDNLRTILYADKDFMELNRRGNNMYSVGLNNYCRFAEGKNFASIKDKVTLLDIPVEAEEAIDLKHKIWKRSGVIRNHAIEIADYSCEIDAGHSSFIAERTHKPYMEGHHAIPMNRQAQFKNSLDVYANVVCLCPVCHRQLHYGLTTDKQHLLTQIYFERSDRLANSGIRLSKTEFLDMIVTV